MAWWVVTPRLCPEALTSSRLLTHYSRRATSWWWATLLACWLACLTATVGDLT